MFNIYANLTVNFWLTFLNLSNILIQQPHWAIYKNQISSNAESALQTTPLENSSYITNCIHHILSKRTYKIYQLSANPNTDHTSGNSSLRDSGTSLHPPSLPPPSPSPQVGLLASFPPVSTLLSLSSSLTFQSIIATLTFFTWFKQFFLQPLPSNTPNPEVLISEIKRLRDRWSHFHFLIVSSHFHFLIISSCFHFLIISSFQIFSSHFHLLIIILSLSLSHQQDQETVRQVFSLSILPLWLFQATCAGVGEHANVHLDPNHQSPGGKNISFMQNTKYKCAIVVGWCEAKRDWTSVRRRFREWGALVGGGGEEPGVLHLGRAGHGGEGGGREAASRVPSSFLTRKWAGILSWSLSVTHILFGDYKKHWWMIMMMPDGRCSVI